jgi:hypothetical protein
MVDTNLIYETPNHEYVIEFQTDADWQALFGMNTGWYLIRRKEFDDLFHSEDTLEKALKWLRNRQIISKDEMLFKIGELCKGDDDEATEASSTAE